MGNLPFVRESVANLIGAASDNGSVLIYDGYFDPELFQHPDVLPHLISAVDRGVNVEVICDTSAQITEPGIQQLIAHGKIKVYRIDMDKRDGLRGIFSKYNIGRGHYMVVDGEHVRTEEPHKLESDKRDARIEYVEPTKGYRYSTDFDTIKREIMPQSSRRNHTSSSIFL